MNTELTMSEEENFIRLMQYFAQYTEYSADRIEEVVHEIMDNPHIYPEYFNWLITSTVKKVGITKPVMNTILAVKLVQC